LGQGYSRSWELRTEIDSRQLATREPLGNLNKIDETAFGGVLRSATSAHLRAPAALPQKSKSALQGRKGSTKSAFTVPGAKRPDAERNFPQILSGRVIQDM